MQFASSRKCSACIQLYLLQMVILPTIMLRDIDRELLDINRSVAYGLTMVKAFGCYCLVAISLVTFSWLSH